MLGIDIIEIERIEKSIKTDAFLQRVFSEGELEYYRANGMRAETLAGFWAAKEAVIKTLGQELKGTDLNKISISHEPCGKPLVRIAGLENRNIEISISHCKLYAVAAAILVKDKTSANGV